MYCTCIYNIVFLCTVHVYITLYFQGPMGPMGAKGEQGSKGTKVSNCNYIIH